MFKKALCLILLLSVCLPLFASEAAQSASEVLFAYAAVSYTEEEKTPGTVFITYTVSFEGRSKTFTAAVLSSDSSETQTASIISQLGFDSAAFLYPDKPVFGYVYDGTAYIGCDAGFKKGQAVTTPGGGLFFVSKVTDTYTKFDRFYCPDLKEGLEVQKKALSVSLSLNVGFYKAFFEVKMRPSFCYPLAIGVRGAYSYNGNMGGDLVLTYELPLSNVTSFPSALLSDARAEVRAGVGYGAFGYSYEALYGFGYDWAVNGVFSVRLFADCVYTSGTDSFAWNTGAGAVLNL